MTQTKDSLFVDQLIKKASGLIAFEPVKKANFIVDIIGKPLVSVQSLSSIVIDSKGGHPIVEITFLDIVQPNEKSFLVKHLQKDGVQNVLIKDLGPVGDVVCTTLIAYEDYTIESDPRAYADIDELQKFRLKIKPIHITVNPS